MRSATPDSDIAASTCGEAEPGGRIASVTTAPATKATAAKTSVARLENMLPGYAGVHARIPSESHPHRHRIAIGLMIICTAPLTFACPSTNRNSNAPSRTSGPVFIVSKM